jgi:DNA-binding transcriptional regulator YiaG
MPSLQRIFLNNNNDPCTVGLKEEVTMTGQELKNIREEAGLPQWRVARALGRSQGWLSNFEKGYQVPTPEDASRIVRVIVQLEQEERK